MIITRTPFRISFFGGGTDYPEWFEAHGGAVLSATMDKYCWITCRRLPPFFEYQSRIIYSQIEYVSSNHAIKHPSARECLRHMGVDYGIEIHHDGDLPARTGLGSSSSFTVGLLNSLYALKGQMVTDEKLAMDAIAVERDRIKENVGCQDQVAAAFGGINYVEFGGDSLFRIRPVVLSKQRLNDLQDRLMLFFTGISRFASEVASEQIRNIPQKESELTAIRELVERGLAALTGPGELHEFGKLLHEGWMLKRSLSDKISNSEIDSMYETACRAGAIGGKLLGAGGGGFVLLYVEPENRDRVRQCLQKYLHVPFQFEFQGSQVVHYQP